LVVHAQVGAAGRRSSSAVAILHAVAIPSATNTAHVAPKRDEARVRIRLIGASRVEECKSLHTIHLNRPSRSGITSDSGRPSRHVTTDRQHDLRPLTAVGEEEDDVPPVVEG